MTARIPDNVILRVLTAFLATLLVAGCATAPPVPSLPKSLAISVKTPDNVTISAQEWGNPNGPEIVMIHGFMQSHLSWSKQLQSDLATEFRIITYDVRGHGGSDKIMDPKLYNDGARYADELNAVLAAAKVTRPVLVGWSYGTRVVTDYLMKYGSGRIAGINYVGAAVSSDAAYFGPGIKILGRALSEDLAENIQATREFVRVCFAKQPTQAEMEMLIAFNMMVPAKIRQWLRRPAPYEATLKAIDVPVLVTHGVEDQITLVSLGRYAASTVPGARASYYEGIGHSPFWEDPVRFNRELAAFVREAQARKP